MDVESNAFEIRKNIVHFLDIINGCVIHRFNEKWEPQESIAVDYQYSHKRTSYRDLLADTPGIKLPLISVSLESIQRDDSRNVQKNYATTYRQGASSQIIQQPIPVKLRFRVQFVAKYMSDLEQMLTHYLVWINPDITTSISEPLSKRELHASVSWDGNAPIATTEETDGSDVIRFTSDTVFEMQTYFYTPSNRTQGNICKINVDFYRYSKPTPESGFTILGKPEIKNIYPNKCNLINCSTTPFRIVGDKLDTVQKILISSSEPAALKYQKNEKDGFYISIENFDKADGSLIFNLPQIYKTTHLDVIVKNDCGQSSLIQNIAGINACCSLSSECNTNGISVYGSNLSCIDECTSEYIKNILNATC